MGILHMDYSAPKSSCRVLFRDKRIPLFQLVPSIYQHQRFVRKDTSGLSGNTPLLLLILLAPNMLLENMLDSTTTVSLYQGFHSMASQTPSQGIRASGHQGHGSPASSFGKKTTPQPWKPHVQTLPMGKMRTSMDPIDRLINLLLKPGGKRFLNGNSPNIPRGRSLSLHFQTGQPFIYLKRIHCVSSVSRKTQTPRRSLQRRHSRTLHCRSPNFWIARVQRGMIRGAKSKGPWRAPSPLW